MALKVKAQEKLMKFSKTDAGIWRYVMMPELYTAPWTTLTEIKDPSDSILSPKQGSWKGLNSQYALILGNEVKGVHQEVVDASDGCIEIPQFGTKHSLNVSTTAGIVIWEFARQLLLIQTQR